MVSVIDVTIGILNSFLVPLIFVNTVTDVTIGIIISNQRYDRYSQLELTLQSVFSMCGPVTDVTVDVLSSWPPLLSFNVDIPF